MQNEVSMLQLCRARFSSRNGLRRTAFCVALLLAAVALPGLASVADDRDWPGPAPQDKPADSWQAEVRARVNAKDLPGALRIAEARIAAAPDDLEARGWRARLCAWQGRWDDAEAEYRFVLERAPHDTDMLLGLATVLNWKQQFAEALALLDQAAALDPRRADVQLARGRVLRALGRTEEARAAFRRALDLNPGDAEARQGLESVQEAPRHQFVFGTDFDFFNFTSQDAQAYSLSLRSDWHPRWTTLLAARFDHRFGQTAGRWNGALTFRPTRNDAFTIGGSAGRDNGIVSRGEAFVEYGRGLQLSRTNFLRGLEFSYQHRWLWFDAARIQTATPSALLYFPRDWTWSLSVAAARSSFPGTGAEWRPSGITRLNFPLHRRVAGNLFFAVGTENFALVEQIGRFSARTWGGGARVTLTSRSDISAYFAYQDRSQNRTQKSFGIAYGIRF